MAYLKGDLVRCRCRFRDPENHDADVDPATVLVRVKTPAGVTTTYTYGVDAQVVKEAVGRYYIDIDANAPNQWTVQWESAGTFKGAHQVRLTVLDSGF
jgi:hypothetical protein